MSPFKRFWLQSAIAILVLLNASAAFGQTINALTDSTPGLSQAFAQVGSGQFTLTVNGTGFASNSEVKIGSTSLTTTFVSSTQVTAVVPAAALKTIGTFAITVTNGTGNPSAGVDFKVVARGDANADASVVIGDALSIARSSVGLTKPALPLSLVDLNFDNNPIVIGDALTLARFTVGLESNLRLPTITNATPSGSDLTITATGLSSTASNNVIFFSKSDGTFTSAAAASVSSDTTTAVITIPSSAVSGPIFLKRKDLGLPSLPFVVPLAGSTVPVYITAVSPSTALVPGTTGITITGSGFSTTAANNTVNFTSAVSSTTDTGVTTFGSTTTVQGTVTAATATSLTVTVPSTAVSGFVSVTVGSQTSNKRSILVSGTSTPVLVNHVFYSDASGEPILIEGTGFNQSNPSDNKVLFKDASGADLEGVVVAAGRTQLVVLVPTGAVTANVRVKTTTNTRVSNSVNYTASTGGTQQAAATVGTVDLIVTAPNAPNQIGSYQATIQFDPNVVFVDALNISGGSTPGFNTAPASINVDNVGGTVTIGHFTVSSPAAAGTFTLARIGFSAVAAGTSQLTIDSSSALVTDKDGTSYAANVASLSLNPTSITVTANQIPAITSLSPSNAAKGSKGFTLTVGGQKFAKGATVKFGTSELKTTYSNGRSLKATLPTDLLATSGSINVTVTNPTVGGGGGTSTSTTFNINNPSPQITSISPTSASSGATASTLELTITGKNFVTGSSGTKILVGGTEWDVTSRTETEVKAKPPVNTTVTGGVFAVKARNPLPGGGDSNAKNLTVKGGSGLTADLIINSPSQAIGAFQVSIGYDPKIVSLNSSDIDADKSGFAPGFDSTSPVVNIDNTAGTVGIAHLLIQITTPAIGSALKVATLTFTPVSKGTSPLSLTVQSISNVEGTTITSDVSASLSVTSVQVEGTTSPDISSIDPNSAPAGSPAQVKVTIEGTNLTKDLNGTFDGKKIGTNFNSSTRMTVTIPASLLKVPGTYPVLLTDGTNSTRAVDFIVGDPVEAPVITSIKDASGAQGATVETEINGSNLSGATEVTLGGSGVTATIGAGGSATKLPVSIRIDSDANTGSRTITVTGPGGTTKSSTVTFKVTPAANKSALTLDPSSISLEAGSVSSPVVVSAGNAVATDTDVAIETSNAQIATAPATITIAKGKSSTTFQLKAITAGDATLTLKAGGFSSTSLAVNVKPKESTDPLIESVDPTTRANTAGTFSITVVGSKLKRTDKIEFYAAGQSGLVKDDKLTVSSASITESDDNGDGDVEKVTAVITVALGAKPGPRIVVITTKDLTGLGNRLIAKGGISSKIGSTANTLTLTGSDARPIITAVRPTTVVPGQTVDVTIVGTSLGSTVSTTVKAFSLDATTLEPIADSALTFSGLTVNGASTQVTAKLAVAANAEVGPRSIVITTADATSTFELSAENRLEVTGSTDQIPTILQLTPSTGKPDTTNQDFVIKGKNLSGATGIAFLTGSSTGVTTDAKVTAGTITVNPSGTQLSAKLNIASDATPGARVVVVNTPTGASSAAPSSSNTFAVSGTANVPAISVLNPNEGAPGKTNLIVEIGGSNLNGTSPQVGFFRPAFGGAVLDGDITVGAVTQVSATTATVSITISNSAQPGPRIVVFSAGGLTSTNLPRTENTFSVAIGGANQPTITTASPKEFSTGATTRLNIAGTNLTGATLKVLKLQQGGATEDAKIGVTIVTASSSATALVADLAVAADADPGPKVLLITTANGTTGGQPDQNNVIRVVKGSTGSKPQVTDVSPRTVFPNTAAVSFTVTGRNFTGATSVRFLVPAPGGPAVDRAFTLVATNPVTVNSDTQMTVITDIGEKAIGGPHFIQIVGAGNLASDDSPGANVFFVDANNTATTPRIDRSEPGDAAAGQKFLLKIFGQNLGSITQVRVLQPAAGAAAVDNAFTITGFQAIQGGVSVNVAIATTANIGPRIIQVLNADGSVKSSDALEPGNGFFVRPNVGTNPVVNFVQPQILPRGASASDPIIRPFIINGVNLNGNSVTIQFLRCTTCSGTLAFGANDTAITMSPLTIDPAGTRISASLGINNNAVIGPHLVVVTVDGLSSTAQITPGNIFNVDKTGGTLIPIISTATPKTFAPGESKQVQITGSNFTGATGARVLRPFGGGPVADTSFALSNFTAVSDTQANVTVTVGPDAGPGPRILQVIGADANSSDAPNPGNTLDVIVNFAGFGGGATNLPTITKVSPTSGNIGQTVTTFAASGTALTGTSALLFFAPGPFGGPPSPDVNMLVSNINVASDGASLTATVTINPGAFEGPHLVVAQTAAGPSPIFADATKNIFSVTRAASSGSLPVITSVNPGGAAVGATNVNLTLNGSNFTGATKLVMFVPAEGGPKIDTAVAVGALTVNTDGTQVTTTLNIGGNAIPGPHIISISTPVGPSTDHPTPGNTFAVGSLTFGGGGPAFSPPNINSVSPGTIKAGQNDVIVTIKGSSMPSQGGVAFLQFSQGAPIPDPNFAIQTITFVSATEIRVKVSVAIGATGGPRGVVIYGPSGGSPNVPTPFNTIFVSGGASSAGSLPEIRNVSPNSDNGKTLGQAFQVTFNGNNLTGVTEAKALIPTPAGPQADPLISAVIVSATTTSLVANVTISNGVGNGPHFFVLKNSAGRSLDLPTPDNTFLVTLGSSAFTGGFGFTAPPRVTSVASSSATISPGDTNITLTIGVQDVTSVVGVGAFAPSPGGPVPDINVDIKSFTLSGNTITATMDVKAFAQNGQRAIVVMTPKGPTQNSFDNNNTITIGSSTSGIVDFNNLPAIDFMSPQNVVQGQTLTLTINGRNLIGATGVQFVIPTPDGIAGDSTITGTIDTTSLDPTGRTLSVTVKVGASSVSGPRFVFVKTPNGDAGNPPNPGSTLNVGATQIFGGPSGTSATNAIQSVAPLEHSADGVQFNLVVTGLSSTRPDSMQFFQPTTQGAIPDPTIAVGTMTVQTFEQGRFTVNAPVTIPTTAAGGPRFVVVTTPGGPVGLPPGRFNTFEVRGGVSIVVATTGAVITSVGPNTVPSGAIITGFKIQGRNLQGTSQLQFFKFGATSADTNLSASNITVNGTGTEVSANVAITNAAESGPRLVVATATAGVTPKVPSGNVLNVVGNSNGPNITSVSPTNATPGQPLTLTINGQFLCTTANCSETPEVLFFAPAGGSAPAQDNTFTSTITSKSPNSLTVIANVPSTLAEPQLRLVVVKTSAGRSSDAPSPSNTVNFGTRTGGPVIAAITPSSIGITSTVSATTTVTVSITGSNLLGSALSFFVPNNNGPAQKDSTIFAKVTASSANSLTAEVTIPTKTAGSRVVIATNANGDNFGQDSPKFFTITNSNAPTLTSVSPAAKTAGGASFTFTAGGTNLGNVTAMKFIIPGVTPVEDLKMGAASIVAANTAVTAAVTIQSGALPGPRNVLLFVGTTPILTEPKPETTFFVLGGTDATAPFLFSASPTFLVAGLQSQKFTLQGNNLAGATVKLYNLPQAGNPPTLDTSIVASIDFSASTNNGLSADLQIPSSTTGPRIVVVETLSGNNLNQQPPIVVNIGSLVTGGSLPHITNITPSNGNPGSTVNVVITGTNFSSDLNKLIVFTPTPAGPQFEPGVTVSSFAFSDSTHMTATLTIGSSITQVPRFLVVAKEGDPTKRSENFPNPSNTFIVGTPGGGTTGNLPTISSLGPSNHAADGQAFPFVITGTNLSTINELKFIASGTPDGAITVSNIAFEQSTNRLTATVTVGTGAVAGGHIVVARNGTTGLSTPFNANPDFSNVFQVGTGSTSGQATITSLVPTSHAADGLPFNFTVNGTNLTLVAKAQFITMGPNPQPNFQIQLSNVNVTATTITGQMTIPAGSPGGLHHVVLLKADNTAASFQPPTDGVNVFVIGTNAASSLTLAKTNGDAQTGPANQALAVPLEVLVTSGGNPAVGVPVTFGVGSGAGFVSPAFAQTDNAGKARTVATLGASATGTTQTFTAAAGEGSNRQTMTFTATVGTAFSGPIPTEMFPNNLVVGAQNVQMTIKGQNFNSVTSVSMRFGGVTDNSVTFTNFNNNLAGTITVTVNVSSSATPGDRVLTLQTSDGSVYQSGAILKVAAATGTFVQQIQPNLGTVGQTNINFAVSGNNLNNVNGLKFRFNNVDDTAITATGILAATGSVTATVNIGSTAQVGLHSLVLVTGSTEIVTAQNFQVNPAGSPTITSLDPGGSAPGKTFIGVSSFKVNGNNLGGVTNIKFKFGPNVDTALSVVNVAVNSTGTQITADLTVGTNAQIGQHNVVLTRPAGDFESGFPFFVNGTGIGNVTPNNGTAGGSTISPFTLDGNNLTGVTGLKFVINGSNDTALSVGTLNINAAGTQIVTTLSITNAAQIGGHNIVLVKGTEEIQTAAIFQVNGAAGTATVSTFFPDNGSVGQTNILLTINGSNFGNITGIRFETTGTPDGKLAVTNFAKNTDNTQITATLNIANDAPTGGRALVLLAGTTPINAGRSFQVNAFTGGGGGTFTLNVSKGGTGQGTVVSTNPPNLINCGTQSCFASVSSGLSVTLSATAAQGSTFGGWSGACTNTTGDCVVTMNESKFVTAIFSTTTGGGTASKIGFIETPLTSVAANAVFTVKVAVQDSTNATVASATNSITLSVASGTTGAILGGTKTRAAVNGVATFNDLTLNTGGSYTLFATASGLASATSQSFGISGGSSTSFTSLTKITPFGGIQGTSNISITLEGTNLTGINGLKFFRNGVEDTAIGALNVVSTGTQITATVNIGSGAQLGEHEIVPNINGTNVGPSMPFTIYASTAPALFTLSPDSGLIGQAVNVTATGQNLGGVTGVIIASNVTAAQDPGITVQAFNKTATQVTFSLILGTTASIGPHVIVFMTSTGPILSDGFFVKFQALTAQSLAVNSRSPRTVIPGGTSIPLQIFGNNLGSITGVEFSRPDGTVDSGLTAGGVTASTFAVSGNLAVTAGIPLGPRGIVLVQNTVKIPTVLAIHVANSAGVTPGIMFPNSGTAGPSPVTVNVNLFDGNFTGISNLKFQVNGVDDTTVTVSNFNAGAGTAMVTIAANAASGPRTLVLVPTTGSPMPTTVEFKVIP